MSEWEVTAITIYCDAVDDESVTLLVYNDGSMKCSAYKKYGEPDKEISKLMKRKEKRVGRSLKCEGPECHRLVDYKDSVFSEKREAI